MNKDSWDGWEKDSPTQLLERFTRRFPDTTEADLKKWARIVGIEDTVVREFLGIRVIRS